MLQRVHDLLKTSTAEFKKKVPSPTNGNGQARNGGNGHHHRARHQIHHGYRRAALKADTAVLLVESGMPVAEAIERCSTNHSAFYALRAVKGSGDTALLDAVLATGATDDLATMLWNSKPDQLVTAAKLLGLDWVWDRMIAAAMETTKATTEATMEATTEALK